MHTIDNSPTMKVHILSSTRDRETYFREVFAHSLVIRTHYGYEPSLVHITLFFSFIVSVPLANTLSISSHFKKKVKWT